MTLKNITLLIILGLVILLPRVLDLGAFKTADEKMWIANTQGFTEKLSLLQLDQLLRQPHPGITTQWLGALAIGSNSLSSMKLPLAIGQSLLVMLIGYLALRLWGKWPGIILTLLLALNPFLIAHTRVYAMDSLLSLFLLISVISLLLWRKSGSHRYLVLSGAGASLAILSKLSGIIIIPFILLVFIWYFVKSDNRKALVRHLGYLIIAFLITTAVVFPSIVLDFNGVYNQTLSFFESDNYVSEHIANSSYYLKTILFFTTPIHLLVILLIPFVWKKLSSRNKEQLITLLLFAILFVIQMSLGAKKGDRYILPSFLFLDSVAAIVALTIYSFRSKKAAFYLLIILIPLFIWQAADIIRLHPYNLSYVNPITKPLYNDRRLGWGEGFDIAARYLREKENYQDLKVATVFPSEFNYNFKGKVIPLNHYESGNADYVLIYRSLLERNPGSWEKEIVDAFKTRTPEKVIKLNGIEYIWIYKTN